MNNLGEKDVEKYGQLEKMKNINSDESTGDIEHEDIEADENLFGKTILKTRTFLLNQLKRVGL